MAKSVGLRAVTRDARRYATLTALALFLVDCSGSLTEVVSPLVQSQPSVPPPVEHEPAYRQIIAGHLSEIFTQAADARGVQISGLRRVDYASEVAWRVCVRAETNNITNRSGGVGTYAVFIQKDQIADRRIARPSDLCDRETYEPLGSR
jgi:hypothetical protein